MTQYSCGFVGHAPPETAKEKLKIKREGKNKATGKNPVALFFSSVLKEATLYLAGASIVASPPQFGRVEED